MAQSSGGQAPIPPTRKDDSEDVAWALSTAEAMYARGDRSDALKWLRRAAESASEAQADDRALELAKAAADLAALVGPMAASVPPPPLSPVGPRPAPASTMPSASHRPPVMPSPPRPLTAPPPAPVPVAAQAPAAAPRVAPTRPMTAVSPVAPQVPAAPAGAPRATMGAPRAPVRSSTALGVGIPRTAEPRKSPRRSRPDIDLVRRSDGPGEIVEHTVKDMPVPFQRRRGKSRPPPEEVAPPPPEPPEPPLPPEEEEEDPKSSPPTSPNATGTNPVIVRTDEFDAWPTQSLQGGDPAGDPDEDPADEKTRIGVPAYEASAKMATVAEASSPALPADPSLPVAQALRVVVWRAGEGVRVAPAGTRVSAPTIDAVLVALDATADLASWLAGK